MADLSDGANLLLCDDTKRVSSTQISVQTERGVDATFYLDLDNGRFVITPESFYRKTKNADPPKADASLTASERKHLADLYLALLGVASEYGGGFFDPYHKRGAKALFNELESIIKRLAPDEFASAVEG